MHIRWQIGLLGLGLAAIGYWATPALADEWNKKTIFTFDQAVEVPGHVLTPGTYVFKLADLQADRDVVQIFSEDKRGMDHLVTTAMAIPDYRLVTPEKPTVTFEERRSQSPEAIHSWFYPGDNYGWDFVYPQTERLQVAANTAPQPAPPAPVAPAPKPAVTTPPAKPVAAAPAPQPAPQPVTVAQNRPPAPRQQQPVSAPKSLPKTASNLPFVEALGGLFLALGAGLLLGWPRARA